MLDSLNLEFYKTCISSLENIKKESDKFQPIHFPEISFQTAGYKFMMIYFHFFKRRCHF